MSRFWASIRPVFVCDDHFVLDKHRKIKSYRLMNLQRMRRKSVTFADSRWAAYAVAGLATSLAGVATTEGEIHYSGRIERHFTGDTRASFPLQDGAHLIFS